MRRLRIRAGQQGVRLTVLVVAAIALVTGCTAEAEQPSADLPAASSSSAEPTPELPPLGPKDFPVPAEARTKDEAGAEAFLRYWIDLINHQRAALDGHALRKLGPECAGCLRIADNYDDLAEAGHRYRGGELRLNDVTPPAIRGDQARITFGIRQEAVDIVDDEGALVKPGLTAVPNAGSGIALTWSASSQGWLVSEFDLG